MAAIVIYQYRVPAVLVLGVLLTAGNWFLQPERAVAWTANLVLLGCMAAALLLVPRYSKDATAARQAGDAVRSGIVFAGLILVISLSVKLGVTLGALGGTDASQRATMIIMGAYFVFTGNAMPKTLTPLSALRCDAGRAQAFQRLVGWTWVLTGLAWTFAWLVLPAASARPVSIVVLFSGMLMVATRIVQLRRRAR